MAALHIVVITFLAVTLFGEGFGVTDEEFQDPSLLVAKTTGVMSKEIHEMSKKLKTQELEITRQASIITQQGDMISRQGEVINRLEEALISSDRKYKPEVLETSSIQNTTIEERVALLEIQVMEIEEDVTELDEDVDFLFDEQVIQDQRLLNLEETTVEVVVELAEISVDLLDLNFRVTTLEENGGDGGNSSVAELEVRVGTLEVTAADHETRISAVETDINAIETRVTAVEENIQGLQTTDVDHDARISALEENGGGSQNDTIAFHAVLTSYDTIATQEPVLFNEILLNEGNGYDSSTRVFTVPPGGDGVYYFSTYVTVSVGEYCYFDMRLNDDVICTTLPDHSTNGDGDYAPGSCSVVVDVVAGDEVKVVSDGATDNTPLYASTIYLLNGFNGFRI